MGGDGGEEEEGWSWGGVRRRGGEEEGEEWPGLI